MTVWFNAATDKFPLAKLGGLIDSPDTNSIVEFSEGIFKKGSEGIVDCFLYATNVTDVKKAGDSAWKWEPIAIYFQLHSQPYEKWGANKAKTTATPSDYSVWLVNALNALMGAENHICLSGRLSFSEPANSMTAATLTKGTKPDGTALPEAARDFLASQLFDCKPITELKHLKLESLPDTGTKSYGGGSYSKAETQAEKLQATKAFLIAELSPALLLTDAKNLSELASGLAVLKRTDPELHDAVIVLLNALN